MIELVVEARVVRTWEEFVAHAPPFSLALDGYVTGPPRFDPAGPHANLNHHEGVDRLSTRSTAGQVAITVKQGLFDAFRREGEAHAVVHVNDPDQDTSLAVWLLRNYHRIAGPRSEPLLSRLIFCADVMDATAGAYPFPTDSDIVRELGWIFEPYDQARQSGHLVVMSAGEMETLIDAIGARIDAYALGKGKKVVLDTRYEVLHRSPGWALVREQGPQARTQLFLDGIRAFAAVREKPGGGWVYSIGRMSPFVAFPVEEVYEALNLAEGIGPGDVDRWGGGNTIGGSPRGRGSQLAPEELVKVVEEVLGRPG